MWNVCGYGSLEYLSPLTKHPSYPLPYASLFALPDPHLRVLRVRPLAVCMGGSNFESSVSGLGQDMRHVTISDFRLCQLCLAHRERGGTGSGAGERRLRAVAQRPRFGA